MAGSSSAASLPEHRGEPTVQRLEHLGRLLGADGGDDRVEQRTSGNGSLARKARRGSAGILQEIDRLLVLVRGDQSTLLIDALAVFFDGHADDVRHTLDRMLLLRRDQPRQSNDGEHRDGAAQAGSEAHCRGNISGFPGAV